MRRREVIALAISLAVWPAAAFAQGGGRQGRVGFLGTWGAGDFEGTALQVPGVAFKAVLTRIAD